MNLPFPFVHPLAKMEMHIVGNLLLELKKQSPYKKWVLGTAFGLASVVSGLSVLTGVAAHEIKMEIKNYKPVKSLSEIDGLNENPFSLSIQEAVRNQIPQDPSRVQRRQYFLNVSNNTFNAPALPALPGIPAVSVKFDFNKLNADVVASNQKTIKSLEHSAETMLLDVLLLSGIGVLSIRSSLKARKKIDVLFDEIVSKQKNKNPAPNFS